MLENELKLKCKTDPKLIWPVLFEHFIEDGFSITKGNWKDVIYWIEKFTELIKTIQIDKYNWENALDYLNIFLYTKVMLLTRMVNYLSLFTKKRQISSCTSLITRFIKDILARTMFGAS